MGVIEAFADLAFWVTRSRDRKTPSAFYRCVLSEQTGKKRVATVKLSADRVSTKKQAFQRNACFLVVTRSRIELLLLP